MNKVQGKPRQIDRQISRPENPLKSIHPFSAQIVSQPPQAHPLPNYLSICPTIYLFNYLPPPLPRQLNAKHSSILSFYSSQIYAIYPNRFNFTNKYIYCKSNPVEDKTLALKIQCAKRLSMWVGEKGGGTGDDSI